MEKLKKKLEQLEKQRNETEVSFYQIAGAIAVVKQLIEEAESEDKKPVDKK